SWFVIGVTVLVTGAFTDSKLGVDAGAALLRVWVAVAMAFQMDTRKPRRVLIGAAVVIALMSAFQLGLLAAAIYYPRLTMPAVVFKAYELNDQILPLTPLAVIFGAGYLGSRNWVDDER
ncbi:MAG: hypothetical protein AAF596_06145, partial [Planctomycetota bacterium]